MIPAAIAPGKGGCREPVGCNRYERVALDPHQAGGIARHDAADAVEQPRIAVCGCQRCRQVAGDFNQDLERRLLFN